MSVLVFQPKSIDDDADYLLDPPPSAIESKELIRWFTVMSDDARQALIECARAMAFPCHMTEAEQRAREALVVSLEHADHVPPSLFVGSDDGHRRPRF